MNKNYNCKFGDKIISIYISVLI